METMYPLFDEKETAWLRQLAGEFGLLESGGSDFHGAAKPATSLGTGKGNLRIPLAFLDALEEAKNAL